MPVSTDSYCLRPIFTEDVDDVFDFLVKYYYPYEPINRSVNRIPADINQCSHGKTIEEGFSLMAVDRASGKLIGVSIQGIATPDEQEEIQERMDTVAALGAVEVAKSFEILAVLEREANMWSKLSVRQSLRVMATAVHADYRGLGLAGAFLRAAAQLALEHCIDSLSIVTSSFYMASACRRLGARLVHSVRYDQFVDAAGKPHLPVAEPHQEVSLWNFDPAELAVGEAGKRPRRSSGI